MLSLSSDKEVDAVLSLSSVEQQVCILFMKRSTSR